MQICREAEGAIFHQQLFEELRRLTPLSSDPTEVTAIGAVESSFKCCAGAIIVLTTSGRCVQGACIANIMKLAGTNQGSGSQDPLHQQTPSCCV